MSKLSFIKLMAEDMIKEYGISGDIRISCNDKCLYERQENGTYSFSYGDDLSVLLCILVLLERNFIKPSQTLEGIIPEFTHAGDITFKMLMYRESGIADYRFICDESQDANEVLEKLSSCPLDSRNKLSASDIFILKTALERIAGMSIKKFIKKELLAKRGLTFRDSGDEFTVDGDTALKIANIIHFLCMLKKRPWCDMLKFNEDCIGISAVNQNTAAKFELCGTDSKLCIFVMPEENLYFAHVMTIDDAQNVQQFHNALLKNLSVMLAKPSGVRLTGYGPENANLAIRLSPAPYQLEYVCDVKTALSYVCADKRKRHAYVFGTHLRAIGLLTVTADRKNNRYSIDVMIIDEKFQSKGYGRLLLTNAVELLKSMGADRVEIAVNKNNSVAYRLYTSFGFERVVENEDYFVLEKEL